MSDQPTNGTTLDDIDTWLAGGTRPEAHIDVCLAGDIRDEHARLVDEIASETAKIAEVNAKDAAAQTMADRAMVRRAQEKGSELTERIDALGGRMRAATRTFHLQALDPTAYRLLQLKHPPRDGDAHDQSFGVNVDTFFPALTRACLLSPDLSDEQWDGLFQKLSPIQWDQLWGAAHSLNRREVIVPKSRPVSAQTGTSGDA